MNILTFIIILASLGFLGGVIKIVMESLFGSKKASINSNRSFRELTGRVEYLEDKLKQLEGNKVSERLNSLEEIVLMDNINTKKNKYISSSNKDSNKEQKLSDNLPEWNSND